MRHTFDPGVLWNGVAEFSSDGRWLAAIHENNPIVLWDVRGEQSRPVVPPDSAGWAKVWASLADNDAKAAFTAIRLLAAFPKESLQFLSEKGRVAHPDATRLAKLIEQLGAEEFADREIATQALAALGSVARPALVETAASSPSAEIRDRAAQLPCP